MPKPWYYLPNINTPCSCLPDDVLREIFVCTIDDNTHPELDVHKLQSSLLPQLAISRVCSSWRRVALSTSELWRTVLLYYPVTDRNFDIARQWLSRAGALPVSLSFRLITGWGHNFDQTPILKEFLSKYRFRRLSLPSPVQYHVFRSLPQDSTTYLEQLKLWYADSPVFLPQVARLEIDDKRFPRLGYLSLWGKWKLASHSNVLHTLHCQVTDLGVSQCWDILRGFPSLEECHIMIMQESGTALPSTSGSIGGKSLRRLSIIFQTRHPQALGAFIEPLALPLLESFIVSPDRLSSYYPISWSTSSFISMAHKSNFFSNLRIFHLPRTSNVLDAGVLLRTIPSVNDIQLGDGASFDRETLLGLGEGRLGSRIRKIVVGNLSNPSEFLDMVERRAIIARVWERDAREEEQRIVPFSYVSIRARDAHGLGWDRGEDVHRISRRVDALTQKGLDISLRNRWIL